MADLTKLPLKTERSSAPSAQTWRPFESLHREIDRLLEDFNSGFWRSPFRSPIFDLVPTSWAAVPVVDFTDTEKAYELTAELPGIDEKNVEVKVANGVLTIKGEKNEEKEEKKKGYYLRERNFGSFERSFQVPDSVDSDKIEASYKKGVLTVSLSEKAGSAEGDKEDRC